MGKAILEESRAAYLKSKAHNVPRPELPENGNSSSPLDLAIEVSSNGNSQSITDRMSESSEPAPQPAVHAEPRPRRGDARKEKKDPFADRKPITEVLHDIYDKNVQ